MDSGTRCLVFLPAPAMGITKTPWSWIPLVTYSLAPSILIMGFRHEFGNGPPRPTAPGAMHSLLVLALAPTMSTHSDGMEPICIWESVRGHWRRLYRQTQWNEHFTSRQRP